MQRLRHAAHLARFVLAWFVLSLGVAMASPAVKPASLALICTASGGVQAVAGGDGDAPPAAHGLDCPLCVSVAPPPPAAGTASPFDAPAAKPRSRIAAAPAVHSAAPMPARGPPAFFHA